MVMEANVDRHDRYLIYHMLGRRVEMIPSRVNRKCRRVVGRVDRVCRNIFDGVVELTVDGHLHAFKEPMAIVGQGNSVVFVYGGSVAADDAEVFRQAGENAHAGETIYDVIKRTEGCPDQSLRFELGPKEAGARSWRRRTKRHVAIA